VVGVQKFVGRDTAIACLDLDDLEIHLKNPDFAMECRNLSIIDR